METQLWYAMTPDNECFITNEYGCTKPQTKPHHISTEKKKKKQFTYFTLVFAIMIAVFASRPDGRLHL